MSPALQLLGAAGCLPAGIGICLAHILIEQAQYALMCDSHHVDCSETVPRGTLALLAGLILGVDAWGNSYWDNGDVLRGVIAAAPLAFFCERMRSSVIISELTSGHMSEGRDRHNGKGLHSCRLGSSNWNEADGRGH
jgi:hypothetical protein